MDLLWELMLILRNASGVDSAQNSVPLIKKNRALLLSGAEVKQNYCFLNASAAWTVGIGDGAAQWFR